MFGNRYPIRSSRISAPGWPLAACSRRSLRRCSVSSWRKLLRSAEQSDVNIEPAVMAEPGGNRAHPGERHERVALGHGVGGRGVDGSLTELARIRAGIAAAQIEGKRAAVGAQTGITQRLLDAPRLAVQ